MLIDSFLELSLGKSARAAKTFRADEDFLEDHFPGFPVVPGVLITEAMGQTAGWLVAATLEFRRWPFLSMVERAKFRRFLKPEVEVLLDAEIVEVRGDDYVVKTGAEAGGERIAEARLVLHAFTSMPGDGAIGKAAFDAWARETYSRLAPAVTHA